MTESPTDLQLAALRQELYTLHNHYGSLLALAYRQVNDTAAWGVPASVRATLWAEIDAVVAAFHASLAAQRTDAGSDRPPAGPPSGGAA